MNINNKPKSLMRTYLMSIFSIVCIISLYGYSAKAIDGSFSDFSDNFDDANFDSWDPVSGFSIVDFAAYTNAGSGATSTIRHNVSNETIRWEAKIKSRVTMGSTGYARFNFYENGSSVKYIQFGNAGLVTMVGVSNPTPASLTVVPNQWYTYVVVYSSSDQNFTLSVYNSTNILVGTIEAGFSSYFTIKTLSFTAFANAGNMYEIYVDDVVIGGLSGYGTGTVVLGKDFYFPGESVTADLYLTYPDFVNYQYRYVYYSPSDDQDNVQSGWSWATSMTGTDYYAEPIGTPLEGTIEVAIQFRPVGETNYAELANDTAIINMGGTVSWNQAQYTLNSNAFINFTLEGPDWNNYRYLIRIWDPAGTLIYNTYQLTAPGSIQLQLSQLGAYQATLFKEAYSNLGSFEVIDSNNADVIQESADGLLTFYDSDGNYIITTLLKGDSTKLIGNVLYNYNPTLYFYDIEVSDPDNYIISSVSMSSNNSTISLTPLSTGYYHARMFRSLKSNTLDVALLDEQYLNVVTCISNCGVGAYGNVSFSKSFYDLYEDLNVSWNISNVNMTTTTDHFYLLLYDEHGNTIIQQSIFWDSGHYVWDYNLLPDHDNSGTYTAKLIKNTNTILAQTSTVYGAVQSNLVSGNFTVTNSPVLQGQKLNITYNISTMGILKLYDGTSYLSYSVPAGNNTNYQIFIPTNYNIGTNSIRLYYFDSSSNSDVLLYWGSFVVYSKDSFSLTVEKPIYMQGEVIKFYPFSNINGSAVLKDPDGNEMNNLAITAYGSYSLTYQTSVFSSLLGTWTAYLYAENGTLLTSKTTFLQQGIPPTIAPTNTPIPTSTPIATPVSTLPPGGGGGSPGGLVEGCPTSGSSLMDLGGVIGCQVFGKIETDSAGDIKNSPQNRTIGYNGLYTLLLIVGLIFVFGTYNKIRGKK